MTNVTKITDKLRELEEVCTSINELQGKAFKLREYIETHCPHTNYKEDRKYHSGGYDYLSSVTVTRHCVLCNKLLECFDDPEHKGCHG